MYVRSALDLVHAGNLGLARHVALCAVQHVSVEEPQLHLLLGKIGIATRNRTTTADAARVLWYLGHDPLAVDLESDGAAGAADFSRIVIPVA